MEAKGETCKGRQIMTAAAGDVQEAPPADTAGGASRLYVAWFAGTCKPQMGRGEEKAVHSILL